MTAVAEKGSQTVIGAFLFLILTSKVSTTWKIKYRNEKIRLKIPELKKFTPVPSHDAQFACKQVLALATAAVGALRLSEGQRVEEQRGLPTTCMYTHTDIQRPALVRRREADLAAAVAFLLSVPARESSRRL